MNRKPKDKPYWEMTTDELRNATKEFDEEFVADKAKPMTPEMRARWERAKAKAPPANHQGQQTIAVQLDKTLLDQCLALAKKKLASPVMP